MGSKYLVEQNGQYLGRWTAHSPEEAINKMLHSDYAKCYRIDDYGVFDVYKNGKHEQIQF